MHQFCTRIRPLTVLLALAVALQVFLVRPACAQQETRSEKIGGVAVSISADDFTAAGLVTVQREFIAAHRVNNHHELPLDAKADYYEWQLWRYHLTPWNQVHHAADLPDEVGQRPRTVPGHDSSTWNGALLAAMSHKYAVTQDAQTLHRINQLLWGMNLFFEVTGKPGLPARNVVRSDGMVLEGQVPHDTADGARFFFRADPAKGTLNQIAAGMSAVMMYVEPDLPDNTRRMLRKRLSEMALHLIDHDYHITGADGKRTTHGDLTPVLAGVGIPFNAQVAFQIVYLGHVFPPDDEPSRRRIAKAYKELRDDHHVYYEKPWKSLVQPQRVAASPFIKGMNDRNHVTSAAFTGLLLERHQAQRDGRELDKTFNYRLGQTMFWSMQAMERDANSLCNFMYAGILADQRMFAAMIPNHPEATRRQLSTLLDTGVEQLRRFPLDRFHRPGKVTKTRGATGIDGRRASDFYWKEPADEAFHATGPINGRVNCGTDYLYAYWLMRHFALDTTAALQERHGSVLNAAKRQD